MANVVKAKLIELQEDFSTPVSPKNEVPVQFNPETLKVSYANQVVQGDQKGTSSMLTVGRGTTKMTAQLWFDVTVPVMLDNKKVDDVRDLTKRVQAFIEPTPQKGKGGKGKEDQFTSKVVRFEWGSFRFDGIMESLEESLEFFSPEGRPLRASVTIGLMQQRGNGRKNTGAKAASNRAARQVASGARRR